MKCDLQKSRRKRATGRVSSFLRTKLLSMAPVITAGKTGDYFIHSIESATLFDLRDFTV